MAKVEVELVKYQDLYGHVDFKQQGRHLSYAKEWGFNKVQNLPEDKVE